MSPGPIPRGITLLLLAGALVLPVAICVVLVLSALLGAMGDAMGAAVLTYVSWAIGALWCTSLVALVLVLAIQSLCQREQPHLLHDDPEDAGPEEG